MKQFLYRKFTNTRRHEILSPKRKETWDFSRPGLSIFLMIDENRPTTYELSFCTKWILYSEKEASHPF